MTVAEWLLCLDMAASHSSPGIFVLTLSKVFLMKNMTLENVAFNSCTQKHGNYSASQGKDKFYTELFYIFKPLKTFQQF